MMKARYIIAAVAVLFVGSAAGAGLVSALSPQARACMDTRRPATSVFTLTDATETTLWAGTSSATK